MKRTLLFFFTLTCSLWANTAVGQSQEFNPAAAKYLWPTEASPYLTSTFAETREGHFHAALDIKTWGRRGYEVYATRDGYVHRIAIGPKGYGKVVYLKHSDGSYSVYAHLLSFNSQLQQLADSIRFANDYQFEIDRYLGWKDIKVEQGEVIGYSGASGIGPPHLHFELRTPSEKPFNPLLTNLKVIDTIAPQIRGVAIEPLSPEASVEGKNSIYTQRVRRKNGQYTFGTIEVSGPVGLGVNTFDKSNRVHNSYAVYELSMSVDGQQFFKSRVDSFSYRQTDQMFIDRIYPILQKSKKGYQRLYVADGNSLPFYTTSKNKGVLNLEPGIHNVSIQATDYYGNRTSASLRLRVHQKNVTHPDLTKRHSSGQSRSNPHKWMWQRNWVTLTESQFSQVTIGTTDTTQFTRHDNGISVNLKKLDNLFMNLPEIGPVSFRRVRPDAPAIIASADQQSFATFPRYTFYDTVSVGMAVRKSPASAVTVDVLPGAFPIRDSYKFYVPRDTTLSITKKFSFYRRDRQDNEWKLIPTKFSNNHIIGKAESLGTFALKQDTTAPLLDNPRVVQRPDRQWLVMIDAMDDLSGIDQARTRIWVNGIQGIAEYEPEDDRFVYYHPNFEPTPSMQVEVTAFDKMGNKRSASFQLTMDQAKK